jgi:hypothetical protein
MLASCQGGKKARSLAQKAIELADETKNQNDTKLTALESKMEEKLGTDQIPDTIKYEINKRLDIYSKKDDSVGEYISFIRQRLENKRAFRRAYKDSIKPKIIQLEQYGQSTAIRIYKLNMIDDGLDWAIQRQYELGAFFGPGKYTIPQEKYAQATTLFMPVIDSLQLFSNKYAEVKRSAYIITLGYADASGFDPQSETYKALADSLNNPAPEKAALNRLLSHWRANEISNVLLQSLIREKATQFKHLDAVDFVYLNDGKGENFPSKKIKDYTPDDPRRRVVVVFWSVLPD